MDELRTQPVSLSKDAQTWVDRTRDAMSVEDKIAQLFVLSAKAEDAANLGDILKHRPGGIQRYPGPDLEPAWSMAREILERCEIPPLMSGDVEGGMTSFGFATATPNQMGIAACDDLALSNQLAELVAAEMRALGFNWSLMPVVDINSNYRSGVVGTRSFGSDIGRIADQASTYIKVLQVNGIAATAKHWPGEGMDERDQHLVTTVNPQSVEEWRASFGRIYSSQIYDGVMAVMSAHIAFPAYERMIEPQIGANAFRPATVSAALNQRLLREELGFRGLIVSDATVRGGLTSWMDRASAAPAVIENGCDVFLFSRDVAQDMAHMLSGLRTGLLSEDRLEAAVTSVLSLKAKLGLHYRSVDERLPSLAEAREILRAPAHLKIAQHSAERSITLVKDVERLLPLEPSRYRRIVLFSNLGWSFISGALAREFDTLRQGLATRGFEVRDYDPEAPPTSEDTDVVLYALGQDATAAFGTITIDWAELHGGMRRAMLRFNREIPTVMVSFGHPYFLNDATGISTYVNAYSAIPAAQLAAVQALTGELPFTGRSPVDPFCGQEQLIH